MKRSSSSSGSSSPWESKRRRSRDVEAYLENLQRIQEGLGSLDKKCAEAQIEIQRRFDAEKTPLIEARRDVIDNVPGFWGRAIINHPDVKSIADDVHILDFLHDVILQDNLDDYGSHTITLRFSEKNIFFPEREVRRVVKVAADDIETVTNSSISWAPGKKPAKGSFFEFFTSDITDETDFGEILRRDLWMNPYPYFMNMPPTDVTTEVDNHPPLEAE